MPSSNSYKAPAQREDSLTKSFMYTSAPVMATFYLPSRIHSELQLVTSEASACHLSLVVGKAATTAMVVDYSTALFLQSGTFLCMSPTVSYYTRISLLSQLGCPTCTLSLSCSKCDVHVGVVTSGHFRSLVPPTSIFFAFQRW